MSDVAVALVLGSLLWLAGGVGTVASAVIGWMLFVPFAAVLIALGICYCAAGVVWAIQAR